MTEQDYYMVKCMEECNELAHRISKALRFGIDQIQSGQEQTNAERINDEFNNLIASMEMSGIIDHIKYDTEKVEEHKKKIKFYLEFSKLKGQVK